MPQLRVNEPILGLNINWWPNHITNLRGKDVVGPGKSHQNYFNNKKCNRKQVRVLSSRGKHTHAQEWQNNGHQIKYTMDSLNMYI